MLLSEPCATLADLRTPVSLRAAVGFGFAEDSCPGRATFARRSRRCRRSISSRSAVFGAAVAVGTRAGLHRRIAEKTELGKGLEIDRIEFPTCSTKRWRAMSAARPSDAPSSTASKEELVMRSAAPLLSAGP
jgi:hypothetical protein